MNHTWNYNEYEDTSKFNDYIFDHSNVFILNPRKNEMELRHDLMAMYIYLFVIFTIWFISYFLEISSPEYRRYTDNLAYNRFGMRIYDRVGVEVSDSESEESDSESEESDSDTEPDEASDSEEDSESEPEEDSDSEEDSDTDYEVDINNHGADASTSCFRLD